MSGARTVTFFASDIELHIFRFIPSISLLQLESGIVAAGTAHFKGFFWRRFLQATIFFVPVLEVVRNPSRGSLVPLEGEDIVIVPDLDLIALFPSPSPISPHHDISGLFRRVFCIDQGGLMNVSGSILQFDNDLRNVSGF
jgi:hypothetical protein